MDSQINPPPTDSHAGAALASAVPVLRSDPLHERRDNPLLKWRKSVPWTGSILPMRVPATQIGVAVSTWHNWERGEVPSSEYLEKLCTLTGLEPNDFYDWFVK